MHPLMNRTEVVGKSDIKRLHLWSLHPGRWLNDEVVNVYLGMISERSEKVGGCFFPDSAQWMSSNRFQVYVMSTQFYPRYLQKGYTAVRRWTKGVDVFSKDLVLFPIHLHAHWTLAVVDFRRRLISYYDSLMGINVQCLSVLV